MKGRHAQLLSDNRLNGQQAVLQYDLPLSPAVFQNPIQQPLVMLCFPELQAAFMSVMQSVLAVGRLSMHRQTV